MIQDYRGDLFDSGADAYAHGCNTAGRMGAGIAKCFRETFPEMYEDYIFRCESGLFVPGTGYMFVNSEPPHVINLATQDGLGGARLEYVESALHWLSETWPQLGIRSVAMPRVASGLGGLDWEPVLNLVKQYFEDSDLVLEIWR